MSISPATAAPGEQMTLESITPCFEAGDWGYADLSWDVFRKGTDEHVDGSFITVGDKYSRPENGDWQVRFTAPAVGSYEVEAFCESLGQGTPDTTYEPVSFDVVAAPVTTPTTPPTAPAPPATPVPGRPPYTG